MESTIRLCIFYQLIFRMVTWLAIQWQFDVLVSLMVACQQPFILSTRERAFYIINSLSCSQYDSIFEMAIVRVNNSHRINISIRIFSMVPFCKRFGISFWTTVFVIKCFLSPFLAWPRHALESMQWHSDEQSHDEKNGWNKIIAMMQECLEERSS